MDPTFSHEPLVHISSQLRVHQNLTYVEGSEVLNYRV